MKSAFTLVSACLAICISLEQAFSQCSTTPCAQPMPSVNAMDACILPNPESLNCYFGETTSDPPESFPPFWCSAIHNNHVFAFTATGPTVEFVFAVYGCTSGSSLQAGILSTTDCVNFNFVSDCYGDIPTGTTTIITNTTPLNIGEVYYLMIDGSSGATCEYSINASSAITSGPTTACIPSSAIGNYTTTEPSVWTIVPPTAGTFLGGSTGTNVTIQWTQQGNHQVCTQTLACPNAPPLCIDVQVGLTTSGTQSVSFCQGESVQCGGQTYTQPGTYTSTLVGWTGCDSVVTCQVAQIPIQNMPFQIVNICGPTTYQVCGTGYTGTEIINQTCTGWQGCDSIVHIDLAILQPDAVIAPPPQLDCDQNLLVYLDGSGSSFNLAPGGTTAFNWTGPGIVGAANQISILVDEAGEYCLTVTHARGGVSCTETTCVDVTEDLDLPAAPTVNGPATACAGTAATYSVTPNGPITATGYTWTATGGGVITNVNATTVTVNWATAGAYQVCATADNDCGSSPPACRMVTVGAAPALPVVTGPASACVGATAQVFNVTNPGAGSTFNWTLPPGATSTGSGASISVNLGSVPPGTVQVCVTAQNSCGTTSPGCASITINPAPNAPALSGPAAVCQSAGTQTYTVTNPQAGVTYNWSAPAGAVITGSGASITVNFSASNSGQVCVTAQNNCGNMSACQPVTVTPAPTAALSGTGDFCQGSGELIDLSIALTGTGPWDVVYNNGSGNATLNDITSPHTLPVGAAGSYTLVSVTDAAGCAGTVSGSGSVVQNPLPTASLTGSGNICQGSGQSVPLTITLTGAAPWTVDWTLDNTAQTPLSIPASPFTLNIGQGQAGDIDVVDVVDANGCDGTASGSTTVGIFTAPTVGSPQTACDPTNTTFVVTFPIMGGDAASYSVTPPNGTLSGGTFTSNPIAAGGGYSFVVTDANNCNPVTVDDPIVICNCDTEVGSMDLTPVEVCGDGPVSVVYDATSQFFDGNDDLVFVLHSANSFSITPPVITITTTPDVSFNPATMAYGTTYYLSAVVGDSDGANGVDLSDPCLKVAQGTPVVFYDIPSASLAGTAEVCDGEPADLEITLVGSAPFSATINGQNISNIMASPYTHAVAPDSTTVFTLTDVVDEHCSNTVNDSETITVHVPPVVANVSTSCDGTGTAFTVTFEIQGGDPSCYLVNGAPSGATFTSALIPDGQGYSFDVSDCHGCPVVTVSDALVDCSCLTTAGNFAPVGQDVCGSDPASPNYLGGEVLDVDDVACFILHAGNPNTPIATSPTPDFTFQAGMTYGTTYYICPVAGNDDGSGCADFGDPCFSIGTCATVEFHEVPTAALGAGTDICEGDLATLTLTLTGAAPWTIVYEDASANTDVLTAFASPFTFDVSPAGTTTFTVTSVEDDFCTGTVSGTADVGVNTPPTIANVVETCNPSATGYTVTFDIAGGDPASYTVTPSLSGTVSGSSFTGNFIPNGQPYTYQVDDANGCGPAETTGVNDCACLTSAGTMTGANLEFCVDEPADVTPTVNEFLDSDDTLVYVLHTGSGSALGTVIASGTTPVFNFLPGTMSPGVTYYISAVAGTAGGGAIGINLADACLDVAVGTPVLFNALPTASIAGTTAICEGGSADVTLTLTGEGAFVVSFENNGAPQTLPVPQPGDFTQTLTPSATTTLTLVSILDQGTGCANTAAGSVTLTVSDPVTAGSPTADFELCADDAQPLDLDDNLAGADPGGQWTDPDGNVVPNGVLDAALLTPGAYAFTYTVTAAPPCLDDDAVVNVIVNAPPIADAGADFELTCNDTVATLGGSGTTSGVTHAWTGTGSISDPSAQFPTVVEPGIYLLTVTSPDGCKSADEVTVTLSNEMPVPHVSVSPVSCFGESDGFIVVDSVTSGKPPYLYSFDGSPFSPQKEFTNLSPGAHVLVVQDASGCSTTLTFNVPEPVEVTVQVNGSFEGSDPLVELGDPLTLTVTTTPPFNTLDTIVWSPAGVVPCDSCDKNTVYLTQQTTFTIMVSKDGCEDEADLTVFVKKTRPVYVPNAFSPNDDGVNDLLSIYGGSSVAKVKSFLVFSRWGEVVWEFYDFQPNDLLIGWGGEHRGEPLDPAVFAWFADVEFLDGSSEIFKGDVSLLR